MDFCVLYVSSNGYIYKSNIYNVCFTTVCITLEIPCVDISTLKILEQIVARKNKLNLG